MDIAKLTSKYRWATFWLILSTILMIWAYTYIDANQSAGVESFWAGASTGAAFALSVVRYFTTQIALMRAKGELS